MLNIDPKKFNFAKHKYTKTLGVLVDKNDSWKNHIDATCKKISKAIGLLRRVKNVITWKSETIIPDTSNALFWLVALWYGIVAQTI